MADPDPSLLDLTVRDLFESVAARTPAPGGGGVAALVTALAAGLAGMAARYGDGTGAEHADTLRAAVAPLADADAAAYRAYLAATRLSRDDPGRAEAIALARQEAIAVPARIAELAGEVADLAADLTRTGNPHLRGDATAAVHLAAAAATTAAGLIAENIKGDSGASELDRARAIGASARGLAEAALHR